MKIKNLMYLSKTRFSKNPISKADFSEGARGKRTELKFVLLTLVTNNHPNYRHQFN